MEERMIAACIEAALQARRYAYAPYSSFWVGAALLCQRGALYTGCNIENAAHAPGCCAERVAFMKAVSAGERRFEAIAVVGAHKDAQVLDMCMPCGVCRQVMLEFCEAETFEVIVARSPSSYRVFTLAELMPHPFVREGGEAI